MTKSTRTLRTPAERAIAALGVEQRRRGPRRAGRLRGREGTVMSLPDVEHCGQIVRPEVFVHEDGERRFSWRCSSCGLAVRLRRPMLDSILSAVSRSGVPLRAIPLDVLSVGSQRGVRR